MKKVLSILTTLVLCVSLASCSVSRGEKNVENIDFKIRSCAGTALSGVSPSNDNQYAVIADKQGLDNFAEDVKSEFETASGYSNDNIDYSASGFDFICAKYDEAFFADNNLVVVRRYHPTEKPLNITKVDITDGNFTISADLESGGDAADVYRFYFIAVSRLYGSEKSTVTLNVSSKEPETSGFENTALISKGYNYKKITDLAYADEIISIIKSYKLTTPSVPYETDTYDLTLNDCLFVGNGFSAMVTSKFIIINEVEYEPNDELRNRVIDIYNSLNAEIVTETPPEYDTETSTTA